VQLLKTSGLNPDRPEAPLPLSAPLDAPPKPAPPAAPGGPGGGGPGQSAPRLAAAESLARTVACFLEAAPPGAPRAAAVAALLAALVCAAPATARGLLCLFAAAGRAAVLRPASNGAARCEGGLSNRPRILGRSDGALRPGASSSSSPLSRSQQSTSRPVVACPSTPRGSRA
jgi:hypothetical protein